MHYTRFHRCNIARGRVSGPRVRHATAQCVLTQQICMRRQQQAETMKQKLDHAVNSGISAAFSETFCPHDDDMITPGQEDGGPEDLRLGSFSQVHPCVLLLKTMHSVPAGADSKRGGVVLGVCVLHFLLQAPCCHYRPKRNFTVTGGPSTLRPRRSTVPSAHQMSGKQNPWRPLAIRAEMCTTFMHVVRLVWRRFPP